MSQPNVDVGSQGGFSQLDDIASLGTDPQAPLAAPSSMQIGEALLLQSQDLYNSQALMANFINSQSQPLFTAPAPCSLPASLQPAVDLSTMCFAATAAQHAAVMCAAACEVPSVQSYMLALAQKQRADMEKHSETQQEAKCLKTTHHSLLKPEHKHSRATRRGPMDEMRQLVRILVKLVPRSAAYLSVTEEGGGGNRVSEEQIKEYLRRVLGEAPQPEWGLPHGWGAYLGELFTWALGRDVSKEEAMMCARRQPGRSWEAVTEELDKMGLAPHLWNLPLSQAQIRESNISAEPEATHSDPVAGSGAVSESPSHSTRNVAEFLTGLHRGHVGGGREQKRQKRMPAMTATSTPTSNAAVGGSTPNTATAAGTWQIPQELVAGPTSAAFDPSQLSVLRCWQIAATCLQNAAGREDSISQDQHAHLSLLHGIVSDVVLKGFKFMAAPPRHGAASVSPANAGTMHAPPPVLPSVSPASTPPVGASATVATGTRPPVAPGSRSAAPAAAANGVATAAATGHPVQLPATVTPVIPIPLRPSVMPMPPDAFAALNNMYIAQYMATLAAAGQQQHAATAAGGVASLLQLLTPPAAPAVFPTPPVKAASSLSGVEPGMPTAAPSAPAAGKAEGTKEGPTAAVASILASVAAAAGTSNGGPPSKGNGDLPSVIPAMSQVARNAVPMSNPSVTAAVPSSRMDAPVAPSAVGAGAAAAPEPRDDGSSQSQHDAMMSDSFPETANDLHDSKAPGSSARPLLELRNTLLGHIEGVAAPTPSPVTLPEAGSAAAANMLQNLQMFLNNAEKGAQGVMGAGQVGGALAVNQAAAAAAKGASD